MYYIDELDQLYSSLLQNFEDSDKRQIVLNLIDDLQNQIEDL
jgi:hypothetical protein